MWLIVDVIIMFVFSVTLGNWMAGKLYIHGWFGYERMKYVKAFCALIAGIISVFYLVIRGG